MNYSASMVKYSFWYVDTKKVAEFLLDNLTRDDIINLSINDNVFQLNTKSRAKEVASILFKRLDGFSDDLLNYLINADYQYGKLIVFISILRIDRLYFEFMHEVFRDHVILGNYTLKRADVELFFINKANQFEQINNWKDTTINNLINKYLLFLKEANLIQQKGNGEYKIINPFIDKSLIKLLRDNKLTTYLNTIIN